MHARIVSATVAVVALVVGACGGSSDEASSETTVAATVATANDTTIATAEPTPPTTAPPVAPSAANRLPVNTGPDLDWVEVATDVTVPAGELVWTGSSFIVASHDRSGLVLLRSVDGVDWSPLADLPDGVDLFGVNAVDDSILLWGENPNPPERVERPVLAEAVPAMAPDDVVMFLSTDGGESWDDLELDLPEDVSASPYLRSYAGFATGAIKGDDVIVVVETAVGLDVDLILTENGVETGGFRYGYDLGPSGLSICLFAAASIPQDWYESDGPIDLDDERLGPCDDEITLTVAELGLTDSDVADLMTGPFPYRVFRSSGGRPFEVADADDLVGGPAWRSAWLTVVGDEFVGAMINETSEMAVVRSSDGLRWEVGEPTRTLVEQVTTDGSNLFGVDWSAQPPDVVRSEDGGRTWLRVDVLDQFVYSAAGGPSGIAVFGQLSDQPGADDPQPFLIEKDGYGLKISDEDGLMLVDIATGETVLAFGPEEMERDEVPEFVIDDENGTTFLDPDTREPLVTITEEDWLATYDSTMEQPELFVGWSADGERWAWRTTADAFGANGAVQLAVGDGVVVALYQALDASDATTVRIFSAPAG